MQPWLNDIMEQLHQQVVWTGAAIVGGPDEAGKMRVILYVIVHVLLSSTNGVVSVGEETDVNGHNFWQALANEIGWELTDLLTWSKHFLKKTNPGLWLTISHIYRANPGCSVSHGNGGTRTRLVS